MTGPFTAAFAQGDGKIIAYIEELPATHAEGAMRNGKAWARTSGAALTSVSR